jgi:hypothetical protein
MPNAQSPILLYERLRPKRSYAAGFTTYLGSGSIERSRDARHESLSTSAQSPILLYERLRQRLTSAPAPSSEVEMLGTSRSVQVPNPQCPIPNTSLREAAPTTYLGSGSIERSRDARHESLSTSAQFPMPNPQSPMPNPQSPIPNPQSPIPNAQ